MASHDDDTMPEETQGYKLSQPKQTLAEYQQMGAFISTFTFLAITSDLRAFRHIVPFSITIPPSFIIAAQQMPGHAATRQELSL